LKSILGEFCCRLAPEKSPTSSWTNWKSFASVRSVTKGRGGTQRNRYAKVSQLYNFAIKKDWATKNLAASLDVPSADDDKEPEYLAVDEVVRLLAVAMSLAFYRTLCWPSFSASSGGSSEARLEGRSLRGRLRGHFEGGGEDSRAPRSTHQSSSGSLVVHPPT